MKRISTSLTYLLLVITMVCPVFAQSSAQTPQTQKRTAKRPTPKTLQAPVKTGTELPVQSVGASVRVQAVLIPRDDVNRIFGKEIGKNYAVIQLIVGNKSADAALIIHGIFIDYSHWALSGALPGSSPVSVTGDQFQAVSKPNQIASEEYRVVRGQLLDAKNWTWRNWTVRGLTFLGSLAGAGTFAFNAKETQLIAALNGNLVTGVETLWPDATIDQLNRVSDFGYQANKVIPQNGSEVVVCFFPIDRFLTPGFKQLFLKSPALFFSPLEMLVDRTITPAVERVLGENLGIGNGLDLTVLRESLGCYLRVKRYLAQLAKANNKKGIDARAQDRPEKQEVEAKTADNANTEQEAKPEAIANDEQDDRTEDEILSEVIRATCLRKFGLQNIDGDISLIPGPEAENFKKFVVLDYISQMSLNNVTVVVDGVMTVDTGTLVGKIDGVGFDELSKCGDHHKPCFWTDTDANGGVRTGTIDGSYLTGGTVKITNADALNIKDVTTISDGSSDQKLRFSFKLTKLIGNQAHINFVISKPTKEAAKDTKTKDSLPWDYLVDYGAVNAPSISDVKFDASASSLTVNGGVFVDTPKNPLAVTLHTPDGKATKVDITTFTPTSTKLVIPMEQKTAGCWSVEVSVGTQTPAKKGFVITPAPKITSVKLDQGNIVIEGTELVDTSACGGKTLSFKFVRDGAQQGVQLTGATTSSPTKWIFPKDGNEQSRVGKTSGTTQVLLDTDVKDSKPGPPPVKTAKKKTP